MPEQSPQRQRLRALMEARREELGLAWTEVAAVGGSSVKTLHQVRTLDLGIAPGTQRAIKAGLQWVPGSVRRFLAEGADPVPLEHAAPAAAIQARPVPPVRREHAPADDPKLESFIQGVNDDLAEAMRKHGPNFTGAQAFAVAHEAETWDDPDRLMPDPGDRVRLIARNRRRAGEWQSEERRIGLLRS